MPRKPRTPLHEEGANPEYEVGYKKPPRTPKGGPSRNPKGRPKKDREDLTAIMKRVDAMPVRITEKGRSRAVSTTEGMVANLRARALGGDLPSVRLWFELFKDRVAEPALTRQQILEEEFAGAREQLMAKLDALERFKDEEEAAKSQTEAARSA